MIIWGKIIAYVMYQCTHDHLFIGAVGLCARSCLQ